MRARLGLEPSSNNLLPTYLTRIGGYTGMLVADVLRMLQSMDAQAIVFPSLDTAYSKHVTSNYAATGYDIPMISEIISERKQRINDIDTMIDQTHSIADKLRRKREEIVSSLKAYEGLVSCIRRLPLEILKEIFLQCLPQTDCIEPNTRTAPLLLTEICKGWREVALDTPRLWCSLRIRVSKTWAWQFQVDPLSSFRDWLTNSKGCPLSLDASIIPPLRYSGWRKSCLGLLKSHSSRLKDFIIYFSQADGLDMLFEDTPILERLCLSGDMEMMGAQQISIIQPRPCLRTLLINTTSFDVNVLTRFKPGWTNLTQLFMYIEDSRPDDAVFWMLLQMCPNLEHFVYSSVSISKHTAPVSLTHPKLRLLDISDVHGHGPLLNFVSLPNLRHLHVRNEPSNFEDIDISLPIDLPSASDATRHRMCSMSLKNSRPHDLFEVFNPGWTNLTHLEVDLREDGSIVCELLHRCPNLEHLAVDASWSIRDGFRAPPPLSIIHCVLHSLNIKIHGATIHNVLEQMTLSNLRHLDISLSNTSPLIHAKLMEFLSRSHCPLETLDIRGARMSVMKQESIATLIPTLRRLHLYVKEGVDAYWTTYSWSR